MAKRNARRVYVAPADRPGGEPTTHLTAQCELDRHGTCRGLVLQLAYSGPCQCGCHSPAGVAA
jgi:hypothetical protein